MKKQSFLALTLLVGFGSQLNAENPIGMSPKGAFGPLAPILMIAGVAGLGKIANKVNRKPSSESSQFKKDLTKSGLALGAFSLASWFYDENDCTDKIKSFARILATLIATNTIFNHENASEITRKIPLINNFMSTENDENGKEVRSASQTGRLVGGFALLYLLTNILRTNLPDSLHWC